MRKNVIRTVTLIIYGFCFLISFIFLILGIVARDFDSILLGLAAMLVFGDSLDDYITIQKQRATIEKLRSIIANKEHH